MTQTATAQIVHESETQRQFVRLQLPAMAEIQGKRYHLKDLSSGGMAVRDIDLNIGVKDRVALNLILPFADFSLDIALNAEVQHKDKKINVFGLRFVDLNAGQIAILNHVIKAYIAGDIVGSSDILNVVSRDNFVSVRKHKPLNEQSSSDRIRVYGTYAIVTLACVALGFFIISSVLKRTLVITTPHGVIETQTMEISATDNGVYQFALPAGTSSVKAGQKLGTLTRPLPDKVETNEAGETITTPQKDVTVIVSPCECFVSRQIAQSGQYKTAGAPLVELVSQKAGVTVSAYVPTLEVHRLKIGTSATITVAGTRAEVTGSVSDIKASEKMITVEGQDRPVPASLVILKPDTALSMDQVGRPVMVAFQLK